MKSFRKTVLATAVIAASAAAGVAQAEVSANIGVTSNYIWRGASQSGDAASVSGGVDYANDNGVYAGTWVGSLSAEDDDEFGGAELDLYFGYGNEVGEVSYDFGYVYYAYLQQDETDFAEVYTNVGYGPFSAGIYVTTNNGTNNDDAPFATGDIYYYLGVGGDLKDSWSWGFTAGGYNYRDESTEPEDIGTTSQDYFHYNIDLSKSTDFGDFTFTLTDTTANTGANNAQNIIGVVSWGMSF